MLRREHRSPSVDEENEEEGTRGFDPEIDPCWLVALGWDGGA